MRLASVSVGEFGPRDGDPLCVRWEAHGALELVLFGRLHVHDRVRVHVLLQDHRLQINRREKNMQHLVFLQKNFHQMTMTL